MSVNVRSRHIALRQELLLRRKFERQLQPIIERSMRAIAKEAAQAFDKAGLAGLRFVLPDHRRRIQQELVPFYRRVAEASNTRVLRSINKAYSIDETKDIDQDFENFLLIFAVRNGTNAAQFISTTTDNDIMSVINRGQMDGLSTSEIAVSINKKVGSGLAPARASLIASVEVGRVSGWATHETGLLINTRFNLQLTKEWVTNIDDRTRRSPPGNFDHVKADGQIRNVNEPFQVSNQKLKHPRDWTSGASKGNLINCRCVEIFHTPDGLI